MKSFAAEAPGLTLGVGSVFTERRLRGRGHASRLLELVAAQTRDAQAFILFSDVGAPIYERIGYVARQSGDLVFTPAPGDPSAAAQLLGESEVGAALAAIPRPTGGFVVWPTAAQIDWHLERERIWAPLIDRARLGSAGARTEGGVALWMADFKNDRLLVLLFWAPSRPAALALCEAARREA